MSPLESALALRVAELEALVNKWRNRCYDVRKSRDKWRAKASEMYAARRRERNRKWNRAQKNRPDSSYVRSRYSPCIDCGNQCRGVRCKVCVYPERTVLP